MLINKFIKKCKAAGVIFILLSFFFILFGCQPGSGKPAPPSWTKSKILSDKEDHPGMVITDGQAIYFVTGGTVASQNEGTNNIKRISLKDGTVSVLVKGGEKIPDNALTIDEKYLYWSDGANILRVPKEGGDSEVIVVHAPMPAEMAVDDENIYWLIWSGEGSAPSPIMAASKKGGGSAKQLTAPLAIHNGLCLDKDNVYWNGPDGIKQVAKTGGDATFFYQNPTPEFGFSKLVQDADNFYYLQMNKKNSTSLMKLAKQNGTPIELVSSINSTKNISVDDQFVYYFDDEKGKGSFSDIILKKVSKNGGQPIDLDKGNAGWIAFIDGDKTNIYFTDISRVYALTK